MEGSPRLRSPKIPARSDFPCPRMGAGVFGISVCSGRAAAEPGDFKRWKTRHNCNRIHSCICFRRGFLEVVGRNAELSRTGCRLDRFSFHPYRRWLRRILELFFRRTGIVRVFALPAGREHLNLLSRSCPAQVPLPMDALGDLVRHGQAPERTPGAALSLILTACELADRGRIPQYTVFSSGA